MGQDMGDLPPINDKARMEEWLSDLRKRRQELLDKRAERRQRRTDMTKRRTVASHQRMKILTALAQGTKKNKVDTFGKNDEDWDVYKAIVSHSSVDFVSVKSFRPQHLIGIKFKLKMCRLPEG